jgi:2-keto-3-deoxy-L-rhamnonate aldolase RhmA
VEISMMMPRHEGFKSRLIERELMMGTFLKTPSPIVCEVLGMSPLDCICIDAEHAPFGRLELDGCIAALRAADMPSFVRVQTGCAGEILTALDSGATGIVLPHVVSGDAAATLARAAHYIEGKPGGRGYAGSSRSARYTTKTMAEHIADSTAITTVIAQIEDAEALNHLDAIASAENVNCLFVGRMDLTLSMGFTNPLEASVVKAVEKICAAGLRHGKAVGMFIPPSENVMDWHRQGASLFMLASDHQFLLDGARALVGKIAGTRAI